MNKRCLITYNDYETYLSSLWFIRSYEIKERFKGTIEIKIKSWFPLRKKWFNELIERKNICYYVVIINHWLFGSKIITL